MGLSPDDIVTEHPGISLSDVHAALSYCYEHRLEIEQDIREDNAYVVELRKTTPSRLPDRAGA